MWIEYSKSKENHFKKLRPRAECLGHTLIITDIRPYIPDKTTTKHRKQKVKKKNGQTAKSRSIQIDIVISYNIIVCNRIRVPCHGRRPHFKNLHWLWHLKMFILVLWMILSKYQYFDHLQCFVFVFLWIKIFI